MGWSMGVSVGEYLDTLTEWKDLCLMAGTMT